MKKLFAPRLNLELFHLEEGAYKPHIVSIEPSATRFSHIAYCALLYELMEAADRAGCYNPFKEVKRITFPVQGRLYVIDRGTKDGYSLLPCCPMEGDEILCHQEYGYIKCFEIAENGCVIASVIHQGENDEDIFEEYIVRY